ncbi:hypothetical protein AB0U16_25050, partial [Escherichia coli]
MLKQQDMTETAAAVLHFLPADKWVTPRMMTRTTGVSEARCQLILTQLVLAGLAKDNGGYPNTALVGVQVDSEQFGSQQVSRNYHLRGRILQVPSN